MAKGITVNIKDTQVFKDIVEILKQVITDERIPEDVREYYSRTIDSTMEENAK